MRKREWQLRTQVLVSRPSENGVLPVIAHQKFTASVLINVAATYAAFMTPLAGEYRLVVQLKPIQHPLIFNPFFPVEMPGAGHFIVSEGERSSAVGMENTKARSACRAFAILLGAHQRNGEITVDPGV